MADKNSRPHFLMVGFVFNLVNIFHGCHGQSTPSEVMPTEVYYQNYSFIINHPELCKTTWQPRTDETNETKLRLLILVISAPQHFRARLAIRETWGSLTSRTDVRLAFLLAKVYPDESGRLQEQLLLEDRDYGDLLQADFKDAYRNLTIKTISMVRWVHTYCANAQFILKVDDDCFVHPYNLLQFLDTKGVENSTTIYGEVFEKGRPFRDRKNKWYMPVAEFPAKNYPRFVSGPSYVLARAAIPKLYAAIWTTSPVRLEDVYLNGLCAEKAGVKRVHQNGFSEFHVPTVCFDRKVITHHMVSPNRLRVLWWAIHDGRLDQCKTGGLLRTPYKDVNKVLLIS